MFRTIDQLAKEALPYNPRSIEDFGFSEGKDFCSFLSGSQGGRTAKEFAISIGMAKELAICPS